MPGQALLPRAAPGLRAFPRGSRTGRHGLGCGYGRPKPLGLDTKSCVSPPRYPRIYLGAKTPDIAPRIATVSGLTDRPAASQRPSLPAASPAATGAAGA